MSAGSRRTAFDEIFKKCVVGVSIVEQETIDRVNILEATLLAMQEAIGKLGEKPGCVLIDGPKAPRLNLRHFTIVDGDALSFSIACASIVAKVTRDALMEDYDALYPEYGFKKHKGYGTQEHMQALQKHGPCKIHRKSFEPVRKYANPLNH